MGPGPTNEPSACDEVSAMDHRLRSKFKNLITRRSWLAAAGNLAAAIPFLKVSVLDAAEDTAGKDPDHGPITIARQGSFFVGGTSVTAPGLFDLAHPNGPGSTYFIDHMYVQYQTPVNARPYSIVMTHGTGQTGKSFESTPDGRDGFQTIFLRRGYSVYINDQPRRGRAGFPSFNGVLGNLEGRQVVPNTTTRPSAQQAFVAWRLGPDYLQFYPNTAFPKEALDQFLRQSICSVGDINMPDQFPEIAVRSFVSLVDKIGSSILMPHSTSGPYAMLAAIRSPKVKAIYGYELAGYVFPKGEPRAEIRQSNGFIYQTNAYEVPMEDFMKLTKIPIAIVYGDNIPTSPDPVLARDGRRCQVLAAKMFVEVVNRHGGDAKFISLPEVGLHGNTHFMFFDKNNTQVADLAFRWLREKGLERRAGSAAAKA
jgi:hypothetical protein